MNTAVGVRDLKNQLSHYLRLVKNGETIIITEHNKVIAEIVQPREERETSAFEKKLALLQKEGRLVPAVKTAAPPELDAQNEPEIPQKTDWRAYYEENRADRLFAAEGDQDYS